MIENRINCEICIDECSKYFYDESFETHVIIYEGDIEAAIKNKDYACLLNISNGLAYVLVKKGRIEELLRTTKEAVSITKEYLYTLLQLSPVEAANITKINTNPYLGLQGRGVIVAIIDTGIDYLNKEFQYEDNTTRIISIWDQTIETGKIPENINYGSEYGRDEINQAIKLGDDKGDPKTIVPSVDNIGHGTASAGIIGARGVNKSIKSAATECEFIIVKLKEAKNYLIDSWGVERKNRHIYSSSDIQMAIAYVAKKISELLKPIVVFIPLGTNLGSHDGNNTLDTIIDGYSIRRGVVFVTGTGNEGISEVHTSGKFEKAEEINTIELKVDTNQKNIVLQIWAKKPDKVSVEILSPSGETSSKISAKVEGIETVNFIFEGTSGTVRYAVPEQNSGDELIEIELKNIVLGIWVFKLYGDYIVDGRYDAWILQRELLEENTKFLNPDPYITLMSPSTSRLIISSGYYNQNDNSMVPQSGRGYTRDGRVKPDVACGGVNVITTAPGGGITTVTGSSIAAAVLAGAVVLLLQWSIVQGKDRKMYASKVKNYLIRGTRRLGEDIYPNPELGYGLLDMVQVFNQIRANV